MQNGLVCATALPLLIAAALFRGTTILNDTIVKKTFPFLPLPPVGRPDIYLAVQLALPLLRPNC
jgi:hypothetical protein